LALAVYYHSTESVRHAMIRRKPKWALRCGFSVPHEHGACDQTDDIAQMDRIESPSGRTIRWHKRDDEKRPSVVFVASAGEKQWFFLYTLVQQTLAGLFYTHAHRLLGYPALFEQQLVALSRQLLEVGLGLSARSLDLGHIQVFIVAVGEHVVESVDPPAFVGDLERDVGDLHGKC
jgi:hypothetical protein